MPGFLGAGIWLFHLMFFGILNAVLTTMLFVFTGTKRERHGAVAAGAAGRRAYPARGD